MSKYKKDFPIFSNKIDGRQLVYLDSAATSQKPRIVIDAVTEFYEEYASNIHRGMYPIAEKATEKVEEVRKKVARFINAQDPSEIVFTHGTTESLNLLAHALQEKMTKASGILLTEMEHHSNIVPWQHYAKKKDASITYLPIDANGILRGNERSITIKAYSIISLTHISNVLGTINNIANLSRKLSDEQLLVVDAAQSAPHMKVDVQSLGCDFLAFSGHKMFSPSGVGVLWGEKNILNSIEPLLYGSQMIQEVTHDSFIYRNAPDRFESGTLPIEQIIGLGAAIDYAESIGMNTIREHEKSLTEYALRELSKISRVRIFGPKDVEQRSGVIAFAIDAIHPHDIAQFLGSQNVCVRAGHHCAMPLHKLLGVQATVRASLHIYNDEEDIEALIRGIKEVKRLFSVH